MGGFIDSTLALTDRLSLKLCAYLYYFLVAQRYGALSKGEILNHVWTAYVGYKVFYLQRGRIHSGFSFFLLQAHPFRTPSNDA